LGWDGGAPADQLSGVVVRVVTRQVRVRDQIDDLLSAVTQKYVPVAVLPLDVPRRKRAWEQAKQRLRQWMTQAI
jgi:hypothetical protein